MSEQQRGRVSFSIDRPWPTDAPFTHGHDGRSRSGVKDAAALSLATLTSASFSSRADPRREWPRRRRAAEERDELAPLHLPP